MTVQLSQDAGFIALIRNASSSVIDANEKGINELARWNNCFGGSGRLGAGSFTSQDEGLTKADIEAAMNVLVQMNAWLDEAGQGRRGILLKIIY